MNIKLIAENLTLSALPNLRISGEYLFMNIKLIAENLTLSALPNLRISAHPHCVAKCEMKIVMS